MKIKKNNYAEKSQNFLKFAVYFFLTLFVFVPSSFATEAEYGGNTLMDWVWRIVNFAILLIVLIKFLKKPLKEYLKQRKELIEKSIKEAQEAKELALKALSEVEERLKLKDKEVQEILASARSSGERERDRLMEEADRLKEKILEHAKINIDFEVKKAKQAIKDEAAAAAIKLAEEKIKSKITKDDQERLLKESLKLIEGRN
jgi:F-type H+-transporting ATPase subunit b